MRLFHIKKLLISDIPVNREIKIETYFSLKITHQKIFYKKLIFMNNRKLKEMNKKVIFKSSNINKEKIRFFSF